MEKYVNTKDFLKLDLLNENLLALSERKRAWKCCIQR